MNSHNAVKETLNRYINAIHSQNEEDFRSIWTDQAECSLISVAKIYKGIDSIYHDFLIGGIHHLYETIDLIAEDIDINFTDNTHALIIFRYRTECIRRETLEEYGIQGVETQCMILENHEWKLQHVHYSKA